MNADGRRRIWAKQPIWAVGHTCGGTNYSRAAGKKKTGGQSVNNSVVRRDRTHAKAQRQRRLRPIATRRGNVNYWR